MSHPAFLRAVVPNCCARSPCDELLFLFIFTMAGSDEEVSDLPFPLFLVPQRRRTAYIVWCQNRFGKYVADTLNYAALRIYEQVFAAVPITLYLVIFLGAAFRPLSIGGLAVFGVTAAIIGLTFFWKA